MRIQAVKWLGHEIELLLIQKDKGKINPAQFMARFNSLVEQAQNREFENSLEIANFYLVEDGLTPRQKYNLFFDNIGFDENLEKIENALRISIRDINFSTAVRNMLLGNDIEFLYDLVSYHESDVKAFRQCGATSMREIKKVLDEYGLTFNMNLSRYKI